MQNVGTVATADTVALMTLVEASSFNRGMELMRETLPAIVKTYGSVTETVTRTYYSNLRTQARVPTPYRPPTVGYDWDEFAENTVGFAGSRILAQAPFGATQALIAGAISAELNEFSRIMIREFGSMDSVRVSFERVVGPNPCEFCLFMAAVADAQRFAKAEGSVDYHSKCSCVNVPIFEGQEFDRPASYDAMEETYGEARTRIDALDALAKNQAPDLRNKNRFKLFPESSQTTNNIMREIRSVDGNKPFLVPDKYLGSNPEQTVRLTIAQNPQLSDSAVALLRSLI